MKFFSYLILALAAFFLLRNCFGEKKKQETLKDLLAPGNTDAKELTESLQRILPRMEKTRRSVKDQVHGDSPHVVVVNHSGHQLDILEVSDRVQNLAGRPDREALEFLQWFVRSEHYSSEQKAEILKEASEVVPRDEFKILVGNILIHHPSDTLQLAALRNLGDVSSKEEMRNFLQSLAREVRSESSKRVLEDYSAESGIEIPH